MEYDLIIFFFFTEDSRNLAIFQNLSCQLANGIIKSKGKAWRPSNAECQESFLTVVQVIK